MNADIVNRFIKAMINATDAGDVETTDALIIAAQLILTPNEHVQFERATS